MRGSTIGMCACVTSLLAWLLIAAGGTAAQSPEAALKGKIASDREGAMEGVVVSAKKAGSTITVSVVSDGKGDYSFPAARLQEGRYTLTIRAAGYVLEGAPAVELTAGKPTVADLKLKPTQQLAEQLTNAEWMASAPGADDIKRRGRVRLAEARNTELPKKTRTP